MGGSSNGSFREAGDFFPKLSSLASIAQDNQELQSLPQSPQPSLPPAQRSCVTTPRGCRFPSLDEAHRRITGRGTSTSNGNREASFSTDTPISEDIPLQDFGSSRSLPHRDRPDTMGGGDWPSPCPASNKQSASTKNPFDLGPVPNPFLKDGHLGDRTTSSIGFPSYNNLAHLQGASMPSEASNNTVDRIYKQYQSRTPEYNPTAAAGDDTGAGETDQPESSRRNMPAAASRDGATNRCGFRVDDVREDSYFDSEGICPSTPSKARQDEVSIEWDWDVPAAEDEAQVARTPRGAAPSLSLPQLPSPVFAEHMFSSAVRAVQAAVSAPVASQSTPDAGALFEDNNESGDDDQENRDDGSHPLPLIQHLSYASIAQGYMSGLQSATGMTTESDDDPFKYDKTSYTAFLQPSKEREVSAALQRVSCLSNHSRGTLCSPDGSPVRGQTPHPPLPEDAADRLATVSPMGVSSSKRPRAGFCGPAGDVGDTPFGITVLREHGAPVSTPSNPHALNEKNMQLGGFIKENNKDNTKADGDGDGGDWETVATSAAIGSRALSFPAHAHISSNGIKITGSSIADVSDAASCYDEVFDECASTDRIIQHPSDGWPQGYSVRQVEGSKNAVFLPMPRTHRVNGFAQDSCRMIPAKIGTGGVSISGAAMARKMSDPFRQLSQRRKHRFSPEAYGRADKASHFGHGQAQEHAVKNLWERKGEQPKPTARNERPAVTPQRPGAASRAAAPANDPFADVEETPERSHSFSFDLIPLPEAARLQRIRRASGLEDHTAPRPRAHTGLSEATSKSDQTASTVQSLPQFPELSHQKPRISLFPSFGKARGSSVSVPPPLEFH